MRSIAAAMLWEYWRRGWWLILGVVIGMASMTAMMYGRMPDRDAETVRQHHYAMLGVSIIFLGYVGAFPLCEMKKDRFGLFGHLYTRPISTWALVTWRLLPAMVTVAFLYLVSAGCEYVANGAVWPLLGPALFCATFVACMLAVVWLMTNTSVLQLIACCVVGVPLGVWLSARYRLEGAPINLTIPGRMWSGPTAGELVTMGLLMVAAYLVAVYGVARDRRGDCDGWYRLKAWYARLADLVPTRRGPFHSPAAAQFWFEWRIKGLLSPGVAACCIAVCLVCYAFGGIDADHSLEVLVVLTVMVPPGAAFFVGLLLGHCNPSSLAIDIGVFRATRPVGNTAFAGVVLKTGMLSILITWAVCLAGLLLAAGLFYVAGDGETAMRGWREIAESTQSAGLWSAAEGFRIGYVALLGGMLLLAVWTALGLGACATLTGRSWLLLSLFFLAPVALIAFKLLPTAMANLVKSSAPWIVGVACLLGTAWTFVAARRRRLISPRGPWFAAGAWVVLCAGLGWGCWTMLASAREAGGSKAMILEPASIALWLGILALPLAPLAAAPLALAWNRHR